MASGALSIGLVLLGFPFIAKILFYINVVSYLALWVLTMIRLIFFFPKLKSDLTCHTKGPGFFTIVAGTSVLGCQFIIVADHIQLAAYLWGLAIFCEKGGD